jgi:hypothetical protein
MAPPGQPAAMIGGIGVGLQRSGSFANGTSGASPGEVQIIAPGPSVIQGIAGSV